MLQPSLQALLTPHLSHPSRILAALLLTCWLSHHPPTLQAQELLDLKMKSVFFGGGSYYIDGGQIQEIQEFIESVPDIENYQIGISSHTDNIGGVEYNQWLSKMRSYAVIEQLKRLEIPEERIIIKDNGQRNPLYNNNTLRGRLANRRVDIILTPIYF